MAKYRIKQFYWAVSSFFKKVDEAYLERYLNEEERALFDKMTKADRHHAIRVAKDAEAYYKSLMKYTNNIEISKEEIIIIDNYVSKELLDTLKEINKKIIIVSSNINETLKDKYQKHFLYLSEETTYVVEQLEYSEVSKYDYEIVFKPQSIIPVKIETQVGGK